MQQRGPPLPACERGPAAQGRGGKDVGPRGAWSAPRDPGVRMRAQRVGSCASPVQGVTPILVRDDQSVSCTFVSRSVAKKMGDVSTWCVKRMDVGWERHSRPSSRAQVQRLPGKR